jgi:hypothetical protein
MAERDLGRSPITRPGYKRGIAPRNKGLKLPAEIVLVNEVETLFDSFGSAPSDVRNYAIVTLAYRSGLKLIDILALERRHYQPGSDRLLVPARKRAPEREIMLDAATRGALERWMAVRKQLGVRATAPLLCTITADAAGNRVLGSYVREMLSNKAAALGIDRRVTMEGLRHSGKQHRQGSGWRIESQIGRYLDEDSFRDSYPDAYGKWRLALDLFAVHPAQHANAVGNACRDAMLAFADVSLSRHRIKTPARSGTVDKLRVLINQETASSRVAAHGEALVAYWGTVSDLANRQAHSATREKETLGAEDARRLIFHTMLVMFEVDRLIAGK